MGLGLVRVRARSHHGLSSDWSGLRQKLCPPRPSDGQLRADMVWALGVWSLQTWHCLPLIVWLTCGVSSDGPALGQLAVGGGQ